MERWRRILLEAVQQSRRACIPKLAAPVALNEFLTTTSASVKLFLDEENGTPLRELTDLNRQSSSWMVLVGPEGGWDDDDRAMFDRQGVCPVHLGPRILRTETAPLAVLSILQ